MGLLHTLKVKHAALSAEISALDEMLLFLDSTECLMDEAEYLDTVQTIRFRQEVASASLDIVHKYIGLVESP